MATTLEYVILGHATNRDQNENPFELLAYSGGVPSQDIDFYRNLVAIEPAPIEDERQSQSIAIINYSDETAILVRTHYQQGDPQLPVYQYILVPYEVLSGIGGRLNPLLALVTAPIPIYQADHVIVKPLTLPTIATGNLNIRVEQIEALINTLLEGRFDLVMTLLGAIIHERHLVIRNFPLDTSQRLELVQGLRMLLPSAAAMRMSFSTYCKTLVDGSPLLAFAEEIGDTSRWVFDWNEPQIISGVIDHPYIQLLQSVWDGDISALVTEIKPMDILSLSFVFDDNLSENLPGLTARFQLDQLVKQDEPVETPAMIDALGSSAAPQGRLRYQYIEKLLQNALNNRDTAAGMLVAQELNRDTNLEQSLSGLFDERLESQPDTVYVFIRNRLNNLGVDERWLPRLQAAATNSLEVAIDEGDIPTLASWLELIAREPQTYELGDVLKKGILEAQSRAHENGELGIRLILIAARRVPEILDKLYNDDDLMSALPNHVGEALRQKTVETLDVLIDGEPEYFLLALSHAIQTSDEQVVTSRAVQKLWTLHTSENKINLPQMYQPLSLIRLLGTQSSHQMQDDAIDTLLGEIISAGENDLFVEVATHLANRDILFPRLATILQDNQVMFDQMLTLMNWVADIENVSSKNVMNTYFALLDYWGWDVSTQPMMESVARLLAQNSTIDVTSRHLWALFEACNTLKLESPTRVAMSRILQQFTHDSPLETVIKEIVRIYKLITWSKSLVAIFNTWWRTFTQSSTLVQLQRIDRELENYRSLEPQRQILQTTIAIRRVLGSRDMTEFATAINTAYSILESIADAFDKTNLTEIDSIALRKELDAVSGDLPLDERHILAKNLRELAQHITHMADQRSKPSIMRSDEAIERQLMNGEANPQGSIDVMKWIAGYLGGTHTADDDE